MAWRWASASVVGTSHIQSGKSLEDACVILPIDKSKIIAIVADGAGSANFGKYGAWLACRFLSLRFREWYKEHSQLPTNDDLFNWIHGLREKISVIATSRETTPRQFASTLASILISPDEILTLHIGDSAIVGRRDTQWDVLCWPENGEYASTTYFITDEPEPRLTIQRSNRIHNAYALFSDGVGDLGLSYLEQVAHPKFFDPMIRPLDNASEVGRLSSLSEKLVEFLAGPSVCERTDDDKTLILISEC